MKVKSLLSLPPRARRQVAYNTTGLLEKNRDTVSADVLALLSLSREPLVRDLFMAAQITKRGSFAVTKMARALQGGGGGRGGSGSALPGATAAAAKRPVITVAKTFTMSLTDLLEKITRTVPHFVRCIKPNLCGRFVFV